MTKKNWTVTTKNSFIQTIGDKIHNSNAIYSIQNTLSWTSNLIEAIKFSFLIDWQLIVGWGIDSSNIEVLDFTTIPFTIIESWSHLNYPWLNFGNIGIFLM